VIAEGGLRDYVAPRFARPGDSIIVTKGPAIEASGIFAAMFRPLVQVAVQTAHSRQANADAGRGISRKVVSASS
jgi:hydrogenase maturation factor